MREAREIGIWVKALHGFFPLEKSNRMTRKRQRRFIVHGTFKLEPRTEKPRVRAGKSPFPSSQAASPATPCKVGSRGGRRETDNDKSPAALELFAVVVVFFFPQAYLGCCFRKSTAKETL